MELTFASRSGKIKRCSMLELTDLYKHVNDRWKFKAPYPYSEVIPVMNGPYNLQ